MKKVLQRSLYTFSAFALATCFALTGCTDAFVGPDDTLETNRTVSSDESAVQPGPTHELNGKLQMRNALPFLPPESSTDPEEEEGDSLESDSTLTSSRLTMRNFILFPPPETADPDEGSTSDEEDNGESNAESENNADENSSDDEGES